MILILIYKNSFGIDQKTFQYICFSINQLKFCNDMKIIKQKQIRFTWYLLNICGWFTCLLLFFFFASNSFLRMNYFDHHFQTKKERNIYKDQWLNLVLKNTNSTDKSSRKLKKQLHIEMQHMVRNFHIYFCKVYIYHWFAMLI